MNPLHALKDSELLSNTKFHVARERESTTEVLKHLQEIERRKLYSDLKYSSLFEYATRELGYAESAAVRRIQAMRLMREMPEIEDKLESGALSLSNVCRVQWLFRDLQRSEPERVISVEEKKSVIERLEQKSAREAEKILLEMVPPATLPRERTRQISAEHAEIRFLIDEEFQTALSEVRSLLGPKGHALGLVEIMRAGLQAYRQQLYEEKFGKRRVQREFLEFYEAPPTPAAPLTATADVGGDTTPSHRHIPRSIRYAVWRRDRHRCTQCRSTYDLQIDHIHPLALGGDSTLENLRLLCRSCNLRRGIRTFGTQAMQRP